MADIVVCGDLEREIEKTGELTKLQTLGSVEIINELDPTREFLIRRLRGARAVLEIRGRAALDEKTLAQLPELEMIATTGPHRIDIQAATSLGIVVATTPGVSTAAVADHVCALTLALARHIVSADNALRRRRWEPITGFNLEGKTFGILGLGRIGSAVAKRISAFGVNLIAWGPTLTAERAEASHAQFVSEKELFQNSDILSVHLRYSNLSDNFVDAARLALMKPTALLGRYFTDRHRQPARPRQCARRRETGRSRDRSLRSFAGRHDRSDTRCTANRFDAAYGLANQRDVSTRRDNGRGQYLEIFCRRPYEPRQS